MCKVSIQSFKKDLDSAFSKFACAFKLFYATKDIIAHLSTLVITQLNTSNTGHKRAKRFSSEDNCMSIKLGYQINHILTKKIHQTTRASGFNSKDKPILQYFYSISVE